MVAVPATIVLTLTLIEQQRQESAGGLAGVWGRGGSVSDTLYPKVTLDAGMGRGHLFLQPLYNDQVAMVPANASYIQLDCSAPYPVEWDLPDYFSLDVGRQSTENSS